MHPPPQTKTKANISSPFFGSKLGKPFIFFRFPLVSGCSMCLWKIFDAAKTLNLSEESCFFSEETMIGCHETAMIQQFEIQFCEPVSLQRNPSRSCRKQPYTVFEWWMSNCYGSVNPLLTYLLKTPCCAFNLKTMDWVLPKHWFTGSMMKVKSQFPL